MESMRAVGYNLETALADLVDNSITAGAATVDIRFSPVGEPYVAIIDDGLGMTELEAQDAMRLAGNDSRNMRASHDLGRFGLGLKTASISQCRKLTLVTKQRREVHAFRWDLDYLSSSSSWSLLRLTPEEYRALPEYAALEALDHGTMILWQDLDQLENTSGNSVASMDEAMMRAASHLGLVFHRFLAGEHGRDLDIRLNFTSVPATDPLLKDHKATQIGPLERISLDQGTIELRPYTLPHLNMMAPSDRRKAHVNGSLRDSQGFYIYRAMRLVIWGTWFRVAPKQELGKLARVQVDVPNSLDHLWSLDIKKAQAVPPPVIRDRLRAVAATIVGPSQRAHTYRGRIERSPITHIWNAVSDADSFRYEVNRNHPVLVALSSTFDRHESAALETVLSLMERTFPIEDVYNKMGQDLSHSGAEVQDQDLKDLAGALWGQLQTTLSPDAFIKAMLTSEPFDKHPRAEAALRETAYGKEFQN